MPIFINWVTEGINELFVACETAFYSWSRSNSVVRLKDRKAHAEVQNTFKFFRTGDFILDVYTLMTSTWMFG